MGFPLWTLLVLVLPLPSYSYRTPSPLDSNCLYRRSRCLHDTPCRLRIVQFDSICGESATECLASSPSDCVNLLWQMKHWLGDDRCDCHPLFGASRECDRFGHLLYEHPCEELLRREPGREEYRLVGVTRDYGRRRTTRSPSSVQINEWKKQLSGELFSLATADQLQTQECDVALHQICLRHVSCSQLWNLFRKNCDVDSDNACIMQQREACWQAFEGLLWTGLGRCHCSSNVSDCHWIRLHTNFNKCIYEISRSSGMSLASFIPLPPPVPSPPPTQRVSFVNFASQSVSTPPPTTTTVPPPTVHPTSSPVQWTTEPAPIPTITVPRPHEIPTTLPSQRILNVPRPEDRVGGQPTDYNSARDPYQPPSQTIDSRQSHPGYRNPVPTPIDQRSYEQSQIRVSYGSQHDRYSHPSSYPSTGYGSQSVRVDHRTSSSPIGQSPYGTTTPDYSKPSSAHSRQNYRTQEEANRSSQNTRQDQSRSGDQDYRNPATEPYRRPGYNAPVPTASPEYGRPSEQSNQRVHSQQDTRRQGPSNYEIPSTVSSADYGRSDNQQGNRKKEQWRHRGNEQSQTTDRPVNGEERRGGRGGSRSRDRDDRLGQITQSNGGEERGRTESTRQGVNRMRNEGPNDEAPQQISLVNNQERSRDEYQVSAPGVSPSHQNPTIITSSSSNSRAKGMEEEKKRKNEEKERKVMREERRKMEEKIRQEEERKIEDERIKKEKERDEKRKEKERQEKMAVSRSKDNSQSVSSPSTSCLSALRECESVEECKFQLAELKTRCGRSCERKQCQGALRRFSSFVPPSLSMALSFCSCPNGDDHCPEKELLYPPCIYERNDLPRCETVEGECRREHKCKQLLSSMGDECSIVRGACDGGTRCTQLLLKARGSIIDTPCSCLNNDKHCLTIQSVMIPNHPCLAESRREFYRLETQESSISLQSSKNENSIDGPKKSSVVVAPARTRLTTTTEPQEEVESAPWLTTVTVPTTTTVFTTHAPPPAEGCTINDSKGRSLFFHVGTVLRRNLDWSGRCSSWCECISEEVIKCHGLPCSEDLNCTSHAPQFTHQYGERLYLKDRGPCMCESGEYTCALPPEEYFPQLDPGIYLFLGYSQSDIDLLEKEMPSDVYQRAGFLSNRRAIDIASQMQAVLESLLPHGVHCRLSVVDQFDSPGNALIRVEWNGMVKRLNQTKVSWQWGMAEKACSKYVRSLEDIFDLNESPRYQLVLSTVKQMKVHDMLDIIPDSAPFHSLLLPVILILRYLL